MTPNEWLIYQNQNATRNDPLDPALVSALSFVGDMGIQMNVISGGQEPAGAGGSRTGSTRHDHGKSADVDFYRGGRKLDWNNPSDLPVLQEIVRNAKARGVTGIGAGDDYMGAGRFHMGFGAPAVWGAGGKSANAPDWLREAYGAAAGDARVYDAQRLAGMPPGDLGYTSQGQGNALSYPGQMTPPPQGQQNALKPPEFKASMLNAADFMRPRNALAPMPIIYNPTGV